MRGVWNYFCKDDVLYKFDESVIVLNKDLEVNNFHYVTMMLLVGIYYVLGGFSPIWFTYKSGHLNNTDPNFGLSLISYIMWLGFMGVTFLYEGYIYINILKRMGHLTPPLKMN